MPLDDSTIVLDPITDATAVMDPVRIAECGHVLEPGGHPEAAGPCRHSLTMAMCCECAGCMRGVWSCGRQLPSKHWALWQIECLMLLFSGNQSIVALLLGVVALLMMNTIKVVFLALIVAWVLAIVAAVMVVGYAMHLLQ